MGISNITIDSITDIETLELDPGGGGGPTPPGEEMYPMPVGTEINADTNQSSSKINSTSRLNLQDGDLLVCCGSVETSATVTIDGGGWSTLYNEYDGVNTCFLFWRIVNTATDPTNYTVSWGASKDFGIRWLPIRGANQTTPFPDSFAKAFSTAGDTATWPSPTITTTVDDSLILRLIHSTKNIINQNTYHYAGTVLQQGYEGDGSQDKLIVLPRITFGGSGSATTKQNAAVQFLHSAGAAGVWSVTNPSGGDDEYAGYTIPIAPAA